MTPEEEAEAAYRKLDEIIAEIEPDEDDLKGRIERLEAEVSDVHRILKALLPKGAML